MVRTSPLEDWLSAQEAARYLGVSRERVHQLVKAKVLTGDRIAGRLIVDRQGVENWDQSRSRKRTRRPYTLADLRLRRQAILTLAQAHGASNVRVFGSVARDEADQYSDVDFAIDMESSRNVLDLAALAANLEDSLGCRVDLLVASDDRPKLAAILNEAVPL